MFRKIAGFFSTVAIVLILVGVLYNYRDPIFKMYHKLFHKTSDPIELSNDYYRDYDFSYVKNTTDTTPDNYQGLLDLFYTILNHGYSNYKFYCGDKYDSCLDDVKKLAKDQDILSNVNNFIHPYNSFESVEIAYNQDGLVNVEFTKNYNDEDIELINEEVNKVYNTLYNPSDTQFNQILKFHDYIVNKAKYDTPRAESGDTTYKSNIAYGPLFENYAICSGYTDLMELFLEKLNIKSFKVATNDHVWNAVLIEDVWYNLDLTWDDPVTNTGADFLDHDYFMISSIRIKEMDLTQHDFDYEIYKELKNS